MFRKELKTNAQKKVENECCKILRINDEEKVKIKMSFKAKYDF